MNFKFNIRTWIGLKLFDSLIKMACFHGKELINEKGQTICYDCRKKIKESK